MWFGLCSLEGKGHEQIFVEWMLEQAYAANPTFRPKAFMLDKAGSEHKAVEAVLLRRAKAGLASFITSLSAQQTHCHLETEEIAAAWRRVQQREKREEHLDNLATGATR